MSHDGRTRVQSPRKLKLLFSFSEGLPRAGYGGGQQIVRGLAGALARMGHEVRVVLGGTDEVGAADEDSGVSYHAVGSESRMRFVAAGLATSRLMARWRPDLVCCLTAEVALVAPVGRALRIPVIIYVADPQLLPFSVSLEGYRSARKHIGQFFQRLGSIGLPRITTISEYTTRQVVDIWRLPAEAVVTLGTGLHDAYLTAPARPVERKPGAPLRLLSIGRLALAQKPLDVLARALRETEVPWQKWTIIGTSSPSDEAEFAQAIEALGLRDRVQNVGFKPPAQVVHALAEHDLVLLPSRHESFFMTAYEAIASQRLVLTNDVAEVKRLLGHSSLLVLAGDASVEGFRAALSLAWRRLEASAPHDFALAEEIRQTYGWQHIAARFLEIASPLVSCG